MYKTLLGLSAFCLIISVNSPKAYATSTILQCSTSGFALANLEVSSTDQEAKIRITISEADDAPVVEFVVHSGLSALKAGHAATIIAQKVGAAYEGGARREAVLLRVFEGQKSAAFAMGDDVFDLICNK
jgi:hypothetical protein